MADKREYHSYAHSYLKAEAFCAEMMANGISFNEIRLVSNSSFKKSYRDEIDEVRFEFNKSAMADELVLVVNKDGIYDRIPEGLFHQSRGNSKTATTSQMTDEHRRFKDEEKMARKFFQPFEQEIFRYATFVEQEEISIAFGILNGDIKTELFNFWGIPSGLPGEAAKRLLQLMPWAKLIKGVPELTAKALSFLIDKPVNIEILEIGEQAASMSGVKMGECALGINSVLGAGFEEPSLCWKFTIDNVERLEVASYIEVGRHGKLLSHFGEVFVPVQIDIIFDYVVLSKDESETEDILGYSLTL